MNRAAILDSSALAPTRTMQFARLRSALLHFGPTLTVLVLLLAAWVVRSSAPYSSGRGMGYALGLVGGLLMLGLLLYPLRKRIRFMHSWGALKYWFRFHMIGGIFGPLLVLFHSTFHVGSVNAAVALLCMLLVVASGVVGRFIYGRIHHGLYGSHASLKELEKALAQEIETLAPSLQRMPALKQEIDRFVALVSLSPVGRTARAAHFLTLGVRRILAERRLRQMLTSYADGKVDRMAPFYSDLNALMRRINTTLQAVQHRAQFATYDRLFALWHVIHMPFLCMLVITAIVHVVAVHAY